MSWGLDVRGQTLGVSQCGQASCVACRACTTSTTGCGGTAVVREPRCVARAVEQLVAVGRMIPAMNQ